MRRLVDEIGELSRVPLKERSLELLRYLSGQLGDRLPIISVSGVATADNVYTRLKLSTSLIQL